MKVSAVAMVLGLASTVRAATYTFDFTSADWQDSDWTLKGNANWANDPGLSPNKRLRMTTNAVGQSGTAWFETPLKVKDAWSVNVQGEISYPLNGGADGMTFIFQTYGLDALPGSGGFNPLSGTGLGSEYLAINLESYGSSGMEHWATSDYSRLDLTSGSLDGTFTFNLLVSYNPATTTLQYTFQRSGFSDQTVTRTGFDMALHFPTNTYAYLGFWGGTGADSENHDVRTLTITAVPEPTTGLLVMAALGALGLGRTRQIKRS